MIKLNHHRNHRDCSGGSFVILTLILTTKQMKRDGVVSIYNYTPTRQRGYTLSALFHYLRHSSLASTNAYIHLNKINIKDLPEI